MMPAPRVALHIGRTKPGSTSIESFWANPVMNRGYHFVSGIRYVRN
jgi:hypothetical protein